MRKILAILVIIFSCVIVKAQNNLSSGDSVVNHGVDVVFKSDTLFKIYTAPKGISVNERAMLIGYRLNRISEEATLFNEKDIFIKDSIGKYYLIYYKDILLITVSEADAFLNNKDPLKLATIYKQIITEKLLEIFAFNKPEQIALSLGESIFTILILLLFIWLINKLFRNLIRKYILKKKFHPFYIRNYELLTSIQLKSVFIRIAINIKWLFIIVMVYTSFPILFSLFPLSNILLIDE